VGLKSLKSLNLTNGYPNKNNKNNKNNNNKVKSKPLELRLRVIITSCFFSRHVTNNLYLSKTEAYLNSEINMQCNAWFVSPTQIIIFFVI
jgi:hypothetical protein